MTTRKSSGNSDISDTTALALRGMGELWERRLATGWMPPEAEGAFPWPMVRRSLAALIPGLKRVRVSVPAAEKQIALILAGNTPLLGWSPIAACLAAGHQVHVKMSRDETLWPRLFRDALAEVAPAIAARITLDVWPGDDPRTTALVQSADAVIAYGSDATLAALRAQTPDATPFFGFGHGVSAGLVIRGATAQARGFAKDVLFYNQAGCLSAQAVFVEELDGIGRTNAVAATLRTMLAVYADQYGVPPATDPAVAHRIRAARDMALLAGATVHSDPYLRWTVILHNSPMPLELPVGHGTVSVLPIRDAARDFGSMLGALRGHLSSVGVAGSISDELQRALRAEGVSRICAPGEMQTPPLDWPNNNVDLFDALRCL